jgi:ribosomal protein L24
MIRLVRVLLIAAFVSALPLAGQSWDVVRALRPGDPVKVVETSHKEHKGRVTAITADAISMESGKAQISIDRANVRRVEVRSSNRRLRNLAIGAAVGVAVGVVTDQTLGKYIRNEIANGDRPLYYVVPIGLFGGIGAALAPYKTIYRVR